MQAQMVAALEGIVPDPQSAYDTLVATVSIFVSEFISMDSQDNRDGADCIKSLVDLWVAHAQRGKVD